MIRDLLLEAWEEQQNEQNEISLFRGKYAFLSNFYPCNLRWQDEIWPSVEHAYQAFKTNDLDLCERIRMVSTPAKAKRMGRAVSCRKDWEKVKRLLMLALVRAKFQQNSKLTKLLLKTGNAKLVEGNNWHDRVWGKCSCRNCAKFEQENALGLILMKVRKEFIEMKIEN